MNIEFLKAGLIHDNIILSPFPKSWLPYLESSIEKYGGDEAMIIGVEERSETSLRVTLYVSSFMKLILLANSMGHDELADAVKEAMPQVVQNFEKEKENALRPSNN